MIKVNHMVSYCISNLAVSSNLNWYKYERNVICDQSHGKQLKVSIHVPGVLL